jgi:hypothetical protein
MPTVTDNFNRADGALGANYTTIIGTLGIESNEAASQQAADNVAAYTGASFANDHYAQCKVSGGGQNGGPAVRISGTGASATYYGLFCRAGNTAILYKVNGSASYTNIGTFSTYAATDVAKLHVVGTTLTVYKNGVQDGSPVVDSDFASGAPGICMYDDPAAGNRCDDFEASDGLGGGGGGALPFITSMTSKRVA